jgi:ankyrin repeat protein
LQQSFNKDDVIEKLLYDAEKKESVKRLEPVRLLESTTGNYRPFKDLLRAICDTDQLKRTYHPLKSNCQNFASFVFAKSNKEGKEWSAPTSAIFKSKNKKIQPGIEADTVKYNSIVNDEKFQLYRAIIEGRTNDFQDLANDLTRLSLNSVDSQGYTLLEWGTAFSSSDWLIDEELKKKGAQIPPDEGLFRRNVYFIALQYLPPSNKAVHSKFWCFDWKLINGVNKTGDTALHLALYGEKWEIAEKILHKFEDYDVNTTNIRGDTPLHLAAKLNCEIGLFNKILDQTNLENVNKADGNGCTALHWAVRANSKGKMKFLLDRGIDINAQDNEGNTALHIAIMKELKTTVKFVKHEKMDVNVQNKDNRTALHLACKCWPNISAHSFQNILEKSTDINAQDKDGNTALHYATSEKSETGLQELLKHKDVDVNVKNNFNSTVLHYASRRQNLAVELFKLILEKSTDVNAQNRIGDTALHCAILNESQIAVEELLKDDRVNVNVENKNGETAASLLALRKRTA